ncbi:MAG TPA: hypothetical protein VIF62_34045 [Labilithrix sp.]|jgi:ribosomal protein S27AE
MKIVVRKGKLVIVVVCPRCEHSVALAPPQRERIACGRCGESIEAPEAEATSPA